MALRPVDEVEVPDEEIKKLEEGADPQKLSEPGSEPSKQTPETGDGDGGAPKDRVPFHQNPEVQLYIERQVAKRLGEGGRAYEERLDRLERQLSRPVSKPTVFGNLQLSEDDATIARAIVAQTKREVAEELQRIDQETREEISRSDKELAAWLDELGVTGVLKNDKEKGEFTELVGRFEGTPDEVVRVQAVELWNQLQAAKSKAQVEGKEEGNREAQEARVGSSRKAKEPGSTERSYQQRRMEEPNFSAILDREMSRLGY